MLTKSILTDLVYKTLGAAIEIHKKFGPGLYESFYHQIMKEELKYLGIKFKAEKEIMVKYRGKEVFTSLRYDLLIEDALVVELKAVKAFAPIHDVQLKTYLKLMNLQKGLIINFNVENIFKEGQITKVLSSYYDLPD